MKNKSILVTGATGFVGSHVIDLLVDLKYLPIGIGRKKLDSFPRFLSHHVNYVKVNKYHYYNIDLLNEHSVKELKYILKNHKPSVIINCIGGGYVSTKSKKGYKNLYFLNINTLRNLLDSVIFSESSIEKIIHFGSVSSYGVRLNYEIDENFPKDPKTPHEIVKYIAEKVLKDTLSEIGVSYTILQPSQIYGERDINSEIYKIIKSIQKFRMFPIIGSGNNYIVPFVYVKDVAHIAVGAMTSKASNNNEYIIAWERKSWNEAIKTICKADNMRCFTLHFPIRLARLLVKIQENALLKIGKEPIFTRERVEYIIGNRLYDSRKVLRDFDFQPTPLLKGLKATISWYRENGYL